MGFLLGGGSGLLVLVSGEGGAGVGAGDLPGWTFRWGDRDGESPYLSLDSLPCSMDSMSDSSFVTLHINICRLPSKFEKLKFLIAEFSTYNIEIDVILICETFLNSTNCVFFQLPGYRFLESHRSNQEGGGVGIYVRDKYQTKLRKDLSVFSQNLYESIFCEISVNGRKTLVGEIYRPPNSVPSVFLDKLESVLDKIDKIKFNKIICTDQNIDFLKIKPGSNAIPSRMLDTMLTHGMVPTIVKPTRVTEGGFSLIDNIYVSSDLYSASSANVLMDDISDHFPCLVSFPHKKSSIAKLSFDYRQYPDNCFLRIADDFGNHDWTEIGREGVDESFQRFSETLQDSFNKHCPLKSIRVPPNKIIREKWITPALIYKSKNLHKIYRQVYREDRNGVAFQNYVKMRNDLNKEKRRYKQKYYNELLDGCKGDAKQIWKVINAQRGKLVGRDSYPQQFVCGNLEMRGDGAIADGFNSFFSRIGPETSLAIPATCTPFTAYMETTLRCPDTLFLNPTTSNEIVLIIQNLNNTSSTGLDALPVKLFRSIGTFIALPLSILINLSLAAGKFPRVLKTAVIKPIYKKGNSEDMTNYRPIALLSILSKIVERVFHNRLKDFLVATNFLTPHQYGFRQGFSTIDAVSQLVGDVSVGFDNGLPTAAVMLDVSKAFDALNHEILLQKLEYAGVRGLGLSWLTDYLSDRDQRVEFGRSMSQSIATNCGVPQGSILGPLLFSIFVNDIHSAVIHSRLVQYADDTTIYLTGKFPEIIGKINDDISGLLKWFSSNKLLLSSSKTCAILFAKSNSIPDGVPDLIVNGSSIKFDQTVKLLGIHLDSELNWSTHVDYIHSKLRSGLYALNRCKNLLDSSALRLMYCGLMQSHLLYGVTLWSGTFKYITNKLLISQNKAVRCIFHRPATAKADPLFKRSGLLKFQDLAHIEYVKVAFRFSNAVLPANLASFFAANQDVHQHATRGARQPHFFRYNLQSFRSSFIFLSVSLWYDLPPVIRLSPEWGRVLSWCRRHYLSQYSD